MIFNNPVFKPIPQQEISEYSRPQHKPQVQQNNTLFQSQNNCVDYEKLFTSETDFSSRLTDSQFQNFDNNQYGNYLDFTSEMGSKIYRETKPNLSNDDSIIDQTWLGIATQNDNINIERITKGMEQINTLYNKIGEITENSQVYSPMKQNDKKPFISCNSNLKEPSLPKPLQNTLIRQHSQTTFGHGNFIPTYEQQQKQNDKSIRNQSQGDSKFSNQINRNYQIQNTKPQIQRINSPPIESGLRQQLENRIYNSPLIQIPQNTNKPQAQPEISSFVKPKYFRNPQWKSREGKIKIQNIQNSKSMVNCQNCGENLDYKEMEIHQKECIDALEIVMQEKLQFLSEMIIELNKKLQIVKQNVLKIVQKRNFKNSLTILEIIDYLIINDKEARILRSLRDRLQEQIIFLKNTGDQMVLPLILQLERANLLSEEKEQKIIILCQDVLDDTAFLNDEFYEIEKQTSIEKNKLEQWKKQYETLLKVQMKEVANNKYNSKDIDLISNIRSDWEKMTTYSQLQNGSQNSDLQYQKNIEELQFVQKNDIETKRMFFNIAVQCKLNLPMNHEGKNILIQDVFEKAMSLKLKQSQWKDFIHNEMNSYQVQYQ